MGWSGHAGGSDAFSQQLAARARAGDREAMQQLYTLAGGATGHGEGAYRPDNRNAAIEAWNSVNPSTADDIKPIKNPHKGFLGALGSVLKVAAPIAGMAIPGLGTLAGAAIGAGGSALGGALHGDKFDLGKTALAGLAGAAGQHFQLPSRLGLGGTTIPGAPSAAGMSGAGVTGAGLMPSAGAVTPTVGGGGILDKLGGMFKNPDGSLDANKVLGAGAAGLGFIDARRQNAAANKFNNSRLALMKGQLDMAQQDYDARAPIRQGAYAKLAALANGPIGNSIYGRAA